MPFRFYFFFTFFTFLLLFYPGNSYYYNVFAYHRDLFSQQTANEISKPLKPIPVLRFQAFPEVTAEGVYVADLPSFTPIFERNADTQMYPASTTKIITALVVLDLYKTDDVITVKQATGEGQLMGLVPGEKITVENLLYGLLVHSGNDAAYAFADDHGYDAFIELMNKKAANLGMKNSHFENPAGLDEPFQLTTPHDLGIAARALLHNPYLTKIVGTKEITISDVDYKIFHKLTNVNRLLGEIQGLGGLKTGYTEQAGENLVSFYKTDQHEFIIVILKSKDRFEDTKTVVQWIQTNVDYVTVQ